MAGVWACGILEGVLQGGQHHLPAAPWSPGGRAPHAVPVGGRRRMECAVRGSDPGCPGLPRILHPGPPQYSLSRPSLLGGRRFLWVQWGLGVPEQQDRASALCWGRVEWAGT